MRMCVCVSESLCVGLRVFVFVRQCAYAFVCLHVFFEGLFVCVSVRLCVRVSV